MALGLHKSCKNRLVEVLEETLKKARVNYGRHLDHRSIADLFEHEKILPITDKFKDKLATYIGDTSLFYFIFETVSRTLIESDGLDTRSDPIFLCDIPKYNDLGSSSKNLIDEFDSLPWKFLVSVELNSLFGKTLRKHIPEYKLSDSIRLISPDPDYDRKCPLISGIKNRDSLIIDRNSLLFPFGTNGWNKNTSYLQFDAEGFIGVNAKTSPVEEIIYRLKQFIGLSFAIGFLRSTKEPLGLFSGLSAKNNLIVHKFEREKATIWTTIVLPEYISDELSKLEFDDPEGQINSDEMTSWIEERLKIISYIFKNPDKAEKILLSCEWLFDSYFGKNQLLSFVQATIALEILFGKETKKGNNSDNLSIGVLMGNRCAYFMGKSQNQREALIKKIGDIYSVRSQIVHRGKRNLKINELSLLSKLHEICLRSIAKETLFIVKDEDKPA